MKVTIKTWDFIDTDKSIDIPNFAPNFGVKYFEGVDFDADMQHVMSKELERDDSVQGLSGSDEVDDSSKEVDSFFCEDDIVKFSKAQTKNIIAQTIRWQLAKKRSGNASTKTRSDVSGTTKKPWGQKESGRARQGSLRGPHFRGGGVVFGPHPRSYEYKLNKKFKKLALGLMLNEKLSEGNLIVLDSFSSAISKTKDFSNWLHHHKLKSVLFVGDVVDSLKRSFSNVYGVDVLPLIGLNVLSCVQHKEVIFDMNAINDLLARYSNGIGGGQNA